MNDTTLNRAQRRAAASVKRRAERKRIDDLRERVEDDLTSYTLHPTKGWRRIAGRRITAIEAVQQWRAMWGLWATRNLAA